MRTTTRSIRRDALERLAKLSAESTGVQDDNRDIERLCALGGLGSERHQNGGLSNGKATPVSSIPMRVKELEVLVALCKAAPLVQTTKDAEALLQQLAPYVSEAHRQAFGPSPLHQQLPPWETLSYDLTTAVLALGLNHPSIRSQAWAIISEAVDEVTTSAENTAWLKPLPEGETEYEITDDTLKVVRISVALLGFLNGIAQYVQVWSPEQRLDLLPQLKRILSEKVMVSLEGALSAIRNSYTKSRTVNQWKRWDSQYASQGRPLGAMLLQQAFMRVVEESTLALLPVPEPLTSATLLDTLLQHDPRKFQNRIESANGLVDNLTELVTNEIKFLDDEADYLKLGSVWQQKLAREVKASALRSFLCCCVLNGGTLNDDLLLDWLSAITADPDQMVDEDLAKTVLKSMAVLASISETVVTNLTRSLPRLIVNGRMTPTTSAVACECLARVLKPLSQDVVISTLYSLGNVLSVDSDGQANNRSAIFDSSFSVSQNGFSSHQGLGSSISLVLSDEEDTATAYSTVVQAVVAIAVARSEAQLTALVSSMLLQKISKISPAVDARIIIETSALALSGGVTELKGLLRIYARINSEALVQNNSLISTAILEARSRIAVHVKKDSPFFEIYVLHLLGQCVSSGETPGDKTVDTELAQKTIASLLRPLALLASHDTESAPKFEDEDEVLAMGRDAWFNLVVHGYTLNSQLVQDHLEDLQTMALYSLPLVDEARVDMPESGIELDPVLRRGKSDHALDAQRHSLKAALPQCDSDLRSLSYQESVFLSAALLVSTLRAQAGDCTATLPYFLESKVKTGPLNNCMLAVSSNSVDVYLQRALSTKRQNFAAPQVAVQLATFFEGCCHRISKVQVAAVTACDRIIAQVPSALCQKSSLFALLELLSLMWKACLDTETDEYSFRTRYTSHKANVSIQLSDDAQFRQSTLTSFHQRCRTWVTRAIGVAPLDVKGVLQAYLEDYEDDGAYGHIALGRSFAVEMGELIPASDQRLTSLDGQRSVGINTASDFIAQYTTRQQYRQLDGKVDLDEEWALVDYSGKARLALLDAGSLAHDEAQDLRQLAQRLRRHEHVSFEEVGAILRNAAGVISRSHSDRVALIQDLVAIPFSIFTKQSVRLGISLWLGVIKENPSLESRVLVEVAAGWEASARLCKGFFSRSLHHLDPFYVKQEFAPSSWEQTKKREKITQDLVAPHLALAHFLSSHFSASRLTSTSIESVYAHLLRSTLSRMKRSVNQPLAREVHFHIILLALNILQHCTSLSATAQWRLKDDILSAGLAWFAVPPRWSFGSNRLQVKAERKLLGDVSSLLNTLSGMAARATKSLPTLHQKESLLLQLLKHEIGKLTVWIGPLGHDNSNAAAPGHSELQTQESTLTGLLSTAWREDPRIAVQLATRFPNSSKLKQEIRQYVLREPEKAIGEPDALNLLLGSELPADIKVQLKYLLYWAPINPMAAVTYFMPAYKNHPLIIQYAVRALESHSVDITFFYVPQIVQTLRYDELGYVERYIIEAGVFSGLFAHQIIWNLKANAYKDEDSQVPDPAKPVFDRVMDSLIDSFTAGDKDFYQREFDFFGKVTGISGTLKPLIKRPKPEKKAKIEEELRKIDLDVGVYLPSNPDGVVIGIDRKSGKPLQSHAKAPFMATFRIRKEEADAETASSDQALSEKKKRTYEVWQSAIFKVGDDCRQDVLALQLIAAFRGIFNHVGLDVYVFPYRVTATAPGCGVIDVLPNSISRDMLGREAVNGLYEYFVSKYGSEDSIKFQQARSNFIKSMAAYSIISYLLQFKDRHNGNIMVDDAGHILHIDFGFCFDIAPGGVKFERAPFKLTPEMVAVMGGKDSQAYRQFEELCVKVFLASRQYVEQLAHIVLTMLDSGLPCFKAQTIQHFKERFVMEKSDREAAEFVRKLVHWSERSHSTAVYDYFQLLTNGIPY